MVLRDGSEGVAEALGSQVEQGLHKDVDLERVEAGVGQGLVVLPWVWQLFQQCQHLLRAGLLPQHRDELLSRLRPGQCRCNTTFQLIKEHHKAIVTLLDAHVLAAGKKRE